MKDRQKQGQWEMLGFSCAGATRRGSSWTARPSRWRAGRSLADFGASSTAWWPRSSPPSRTRRSSSASRRPWREPSTADKATALRSGPRDFTQELAARKKRNDPPHPYGRGRVDALGNILNEVMAKDLGVPENQRPADAPVSYPVIWDAHQQDFVQWNGSAPNAGPGPLLRNIGEVLGVFGHMQFTPRKDRFPVYKTATVDVKNLKKLESYSPSCSRRFGRAGFPAIDQAKAEAGKALYASTASRAIRPRQPQRPNRRIKAHMVKVPQVGTDALPPKNFVKRPPRPASSRARPVFVNLLQSFAARKPPPASSSATPCSASQLGRFGIGLPTPTASRCHQVVCPPSSRSTGWPSSRR